MTWFQTSLSLVMLVLLVGCGAEETPDVANRSDRPDAIADVAGSETETSSPTDDSAAGTNPQPSPGRLDGPALAVADQRPASDSEAADSDADDARADSNSQRGVGPVAIPPKQQRPNLTTFRSNQGSENVVTIRIINANQIRPGVIAVALADEFGTEKRLATRPGDRAMIAIRYSGSVGDVAAKIDWGDVTSIDEKTREIRVDATNK